MKILTAFSALLAFALGTAKADELADSSDPNFFANKEHLGIHLNEHAHDLQTVINQSDKLVLVYVYHSG